MASFARTKMTFQDDCFPDKPDALNMSLVGPNVPKLYQIMYDAIKNVFHVQDNEIQEEEFSWGKVGDKEKFAVTWFVHKDMDYFSFFYIKVNLKGSGNDNSGQASIKCRGLFRTEFPQDTLWQRSLFYEMMRSFWHRTFYHKKRTQYLVDCRNIVGSYMKHVVKRFREINDMLPKDEADAPRTIHAGPSRSPHDNKNPAQGNVRTIRPDSNPAQEDKSPNQGNVKTIHAGDKPPVNRPQQNRKGEDNK